jgi:hypothetical protein
MSRPMEIHAERVGEGNYDLPWREKRTKIARLTGAMRNVLRTIGQPVAETGLAATITFVGAEFSRVAVTLNNRQLAGITVLGTAIGAGIAIYRRIQAQPRERAIAITRLSAGEIWHGLRPGNS